MARSTLQVTISPGRTTLFPAARAMIFSAKVDAVLALLIIAATVPSQALPLQETFQEFADTVARDVNTITRGSDEHKAH